MNDMYTDYKTSLDNLKSHLAVMSRMRDTGLTGESAHNISFCEFTGAENYATLYLAMCDATLVGSEQSLDCLRSLPEGRETALEEEWLIAIRDWAVSEAAKWTRTQSLRQLLLDLEKFEWIAPGFVPISDELTLKLNSRSSDLRLL